MDYNPQNTVVHRKSLSRPVKTYLNSGLIARGWNILDFGCGKGFDCDELEYVGYDPFHRPEKLNKQFNVVMTNFVINVLDIDTRKKAIQEAYNYVIPDFGKLLIAVRSKKEIEKSKKDTWITYQDGYITPKKTFQTGFTKETLKSAIFDAIGKYPVETIDCGDFIYAVVYKRG